MHGVLYQSLKHKGGFVPWLLECAGASSRVVAIVLTPPVAVGKVTREQEEELNLLSVTSVLPGGFRLNGEQ